MIRGGMKLACAHDVQRAEGINWRRIRSSYLKGPVLKILEWQPEAVKIVLREDVDVVISHGLFSLSNLLVRVICRLRGIPVIEWTLGLKTEERGLRWFLANLYYRQAAAFLFYGKFARDFFVRHGYDPTKLFIVYNSLDHEKQVVVRQSVTEQTRASCRAECGATRDEDRLVFDSCRLEKDKRLDMLIEAVAILKKRGRTVFLVLIGEGLEGQRLEELSRAEKVADRVRFYGACYDEDKLGVLVSASDLCVVPGEVGLTAMHSLVYGTPVLTCENTRGRHGPEVEAIVRGKTGEFFRDGDVEDLANQMEQMLYPSPCKARMSAACMEIIDRCYTPKYQEQVIIEALNCVLPPTKQIR